MCYNGGRCFNINQIFHLCHVTSSCNCNLIIKEKHFKPSVHSIHKKRFQWLGDGIYFWDANVEAAVFLGKRLVKGREGKKCSVSAISFLVNVENEYHLNLNNPGMFSRFFQFVCKMDEKMAQDMQSLIQAMKKSRDIYPFINGFGKIFGTAVNLYVDALLKQGISVKIVSYNFINSYIDNKLETSYELRYQQFCIKDDSLIPQIEMWNVVHNI